MLLDDSLRAVLRPMHSDVLLGGALDNEGIAESLDQDEAVLPTRTASSFYQLTTESCVIGRDPACHVRIAGHRTDISRRHAVIKREGNHYILYDRSTHGTYVNKQKISGHYQLQPDDIIGLANSLEMLRFIQESLDPSSLPVLTERERDVLHLVAAGRLNKEIAAELNIASNTVNTHLKSIYEKLNVHNRTEAVHQARRLRII
jgi:DNA-binding NarL/FixJ family response regulator